MTSTDGPPAGQQPAAPGRHPFAEPGSDPVAESDRLLPPLRFGEWIIFTVLAMVLAAANIYTTLLIGWGDTGSIVAVLASVLLLGMVSRHRPSVHTLNLGQTMVSAGGSVGFAVASYAAVRIIEPEFDPDTTTLIVLFAAMGMLGSLVGSSVRRYMVRYFFPSGTACAVIQRSISEPVEQGQRNRPVFMLKLWGSIAALLTIPTKITLEKGTAALWPHINLDRLLKLNPERGLGIGVDPLYYGIGMVVGPRIGIGMVLGALAVAYTIPDSLDGTVHMAAIGDWIKWIAIAVLTLPTFATILFAYLFKTPPVIPPGFTPGATAYRSPANRAFVFGMVGVSAALAIGLCGQAVFGLPWHVTLVTMIIAWPLCVVNGRVTGDTDINPVRLVAIVLLSGFFWLITEDTRGAIVLLGMAVVGGTLAAVAVDMMQDYRTGYLVDANPTHQTTVQFFGAAAGALVAIPVLGVLVGQLGIGDGSSLPAPGAKVWAAMAEAMAGGFEPHPALRWTLLWVSLGGSLYAWFTVWPKTAKWMPSIFGFGIGMLVGADASIAIFLGGLIKWGVTLAYTVGKRDAARDEALVESGNDTMLAGSSVFAAAAVISILLVLAKTVLDYAEVDWFHIAS